MKIHEATEQAYKNGYEKGKQDAVKHGVWIFKEQKFDGAGFIDIFRCSECGKRNDGETIYCPNCGCRMDGGTNGDGNE